MELDADDKILRVVADGCSMDYTQWPGLLSRLIPRLEKIVYTEFPIQHLLQSPSSDLPSCSLPPDGSLSQSADKENAPPPSSVGAQPNLPPQILSMLNAIIHTLRTYFSQYPPHTIQRLAELVLSPKEHYRNLPSYIYAVDRVVHVTSPANIYPLPAAIPDALGVRPLINGVGPSADLGSISWGGSTQVQSSLGSDESLGGALLTPIPWLVNRSAANNGNTRIGDMEGEIKTENTETIDGPNGAGSIQTVSISVNGIPSTSLSTTLHDENIGGVRAVNQGELRHEQTDIMLASGQPGTERYESDDEIPHARGPNEIGMEDTGPQTAGSVGMHMQAIDLEAAVGRRTEARDKVVDAPMAPKREAAEGMEREGKRIRDGSVPSKDLVIAKLESESGGHEIAPGDVDRGEGEAKVSGGKENEHVNTMDPTVVK